MKGFRMLNCLAFYQLILMLGFIVIYHHLTRVTIRGSLRNGTRVASNTVISRIR